METELGYSESVESDKPLPRSTRRFQVLVVDDDHIVTHYLEAALRKAGWSPIVAHNGPEALDRADKELPDIVVLDLMMPGMNGFDVCRLLRERSEVPIIVLSVRNDPADKVKALSLGADDYLTKPFALEELVARMGAVLRRTRSAAAMPMEAHRIVGDVSLDATSYTVEVSGRSSRLTPTEYALMTEFIDNPGKVLTHSYILNRVWGPSHAYEKEYVHVFVNRLRSKMERDPHHPTLLLTIQGVGYVFRPARTEADEQ